MNSNEAKIFNAVNDLFKEKLNSDPSVEDITSWVEQVKNFVTGNYDTNIVIQALIQESALWSKKERAITDNTNHFEWTIPSVMTLWKRYQEYLLQNMDCDDVVTIDKSTTDILSLLEDPKRSGDWSRRGLVVGNVQSGKTANYIGLICKAADAGYRVIIVLAGLTNSLREQTQIRLDEGFLGYSTATDDTNDSFRKPVGVGLITPLSGQCLPQSCTIRGDHGDFNKAAAKRGYTSPSQPLLCVVKKNVSVLKSLLKWMKDAYKSDIEAGTQRSVCSDAPLLMIDDEADSASVDTGKDAIDENDEPNKDYDPKKINSLVRQLLHFFTKVAYVGYTATPFANVFIHDEASTTKEGPDLFPQSFIYPLTPNNKKYFGPERLFGSFDEDSVQRVDDLIKPMVRIVSDAYSKNDLETSWLPPKHKSDFVPVRQNTCSGLPVSLENAILSFYLVCAQRRLRNQETKHCSMLIHVSRYQKVQKKILEQVASFDNYCKIRLKNHDGDGLDTLLGRMEKLWKDDFVTIHNTYGKELASENLPIANWEDIEKVLPKTMSDMVNPKLLNGNSSDVLDYEEKKKDGLKVIALGGDKFSRGLTLEGLAISYYLRDSTTFDTLMQMGRWFGYRPGYLDLCRLYSGQDLIDSYCNITDGTAEMNDEFDLLASHPESTPKDYGLKVRSYGKLTPTSTAKSKYAKKMDFGFEGNHSQTVVFHSDKTVQEKNWELAKQFLNSLTKIDVGYTRNPSRYFDTEHNWNGALWHNISFDVVMRFLKQFKFHPDSKSINPLILSKFIEDSHKKGFTDTWDVAVIGVFASDFGDSDLFPNVRFISRSLYHDCSDTAGYLSIKTLTASIDELIDFSESDYQDTKKIVESINRENGKQISIGKASRRIRGAKPGSPIDRNLLMIYPLKLRDYNDGPSLVGISIVLPDYGKPDKFKQKYSVNHVFQEMLDNSSEGDEE